MYETPKLQHIYVRNMLVYLFLICTVRSVTCGMVPDAEAWLQRARLELQFDLYSSCSEGSRRKACHEIHASPELAYSSFKVLVYSALSARKKKFLTRGKSGDPVLRSSRHVQVDLGRRVVTNLVSYKPVELKQQR